MRFSNLGAAAMIISVLAAIAPSESFAQACVPGAGVVGGTTCVSDEQSEAQSTGIKYEVISWLKTITMTAAQVGAAIDVANEIVSEWGGIFSSSQRLVYDFESTLSGGRARSLPALASMPASDNAIQRDRADQVIANYAIEDQVTRHDVVHTSVTHSMAVAQEARKTSQIRMANADSLAQTLSHGRHNVVDYRRAQVQLAGQQLSSSATEVEVGAQLTALRNLRTAESFHDRALRYDAQLEWLTSF